MAGIKFVSDESADPTQQHPLMQQQMQTGREVASYDEQSVAADSWSIKSDYESTLDDEQHHADVAEALSSATNFRAISDYSSDKDEQDADAMTSMLGLQSYWDGAYADKLANFREHGLADEIWFGADVMDTVTSWTKRLCIDISQGHMPNNVDVAKPEPVE